MSEHSVIFVNLMLTHDTSEFLVVCPQVCPLNMYWEDSCCKVMRTVYF